MRKMGITDVLFSIFFVDMMLLMVIGLGTLINNSFTRPLFAGTLNGKSVFVSNAFYYFYYPPNGEFGFSLPMPFWIGVAVLLVLYVIIFSYDLLYEKNDRRRNPLETPIGFIAGVGSLLYVLSIILVLSQDLIGAPISSSFITQDEKLIPNLLYYELIYAPFIEEIEFRIIPIGLYLFVRYYMQKKNFRWYEVFLFPGRLMRRFGRKLDRYDWGAIIITSFLFGFAHYEYGGWSTTKIPQAAIVGVGLALGFMLFGPFVDIPIHFLFDGAGSVEILPNLVSAGEPLVIIWILLIFVCAIATIILAVILLMNRKKETIDPDFIQS
ncbi:type II CAAX prenyl endopeptidase Rce1 family protein [Cuniculiplasma sp. SKW3]|uniref:CPBP family glutamic-type intramembrane protease n=1 Tax=Cuniculiplasma sp. SKW3 TaxID=3400170 RepID=UPI003FCF0B31